MRLSWLITLAVLFSATATAAEPSPWMTDYDAARKLAGRSGKPLLVVFRCQH
jgi:hypothetical protein